jgi:toxin ParE1/3/4
MYRLSTLAAEDFAAIYEYTLLNFGVHQADAYTDDLESIFLLLSNSPRIGIELEEIAVGLRRHYHKRHAIFYREREDGIFVIRILHQQMEVDSYLLEL